MGRLQDGVFVITGGGSLISLAAAGKIVAEGGAVVVCDRNDAFEDEARAIVAGSGLFLAGDVSDDRFLDEVLATAVGRFGGIDGIVSAATIFDDALLATTRKEWQRAFDINVIPAALLAQKAAPHLKKQGGGSIVYVASISGHRAQPNRVVYPVTKAALLMLAKTAAVQLAQDRIRVNTVSPGWTWSRNIEKRYGTRERADAFAAEFQSLGRLADPEEIADAILYLLSSESSFVTGADIAVDGGYTALGPEALGQPQLKFPTG